MKKYTIQILLGCFLFSVFGGVVGISKITTAVNLERLQLYKKSKSKNLKGTVCLHILSALK